MAKEKMRIDIISDVVCPWCIIGYKRLEKALDEMADKIEAEIHWHPFELNPQMEAAGENLQEHMAAKYGSSPEDSEKSREMLRNVGKEFGFEFNYFNEMKIFNTLRAHQLLHLARETDKEMDLKLRLFSAYFTENKNVDDVEVLIHEAKAVGLDEEKAREVLTTNAHQTDVREEEHFWISQGVQGVPFFVFNNKYAISGAHEPETFKDVIQQSL